MNQSPKDETSSDWLVWPSTIRLVSVASVWFTVWFSFVLVLLASMKLFHSLAVWKAIQAWLVLKIILGVAGAGSALAMQFLFVAMVWYWAKLDYSSKTRRMWWFLSFSCGFIGVPIYAWLVYRKQILAATLAQS